MSQLRLGRAPDALGLEEDDSDPMGLFKSSSEAYRQDVTPRTRGETTVAAAPAAPAAPSGGTFKFNLYDAPASAPSAPQKDGSFKFNLYEDEKPAAAKPEKEPGLDMGGSFKKGVKGLKVTWDFLANKLEKAVTGEDSDTRDILAKSAKEYEAMASDPRIAELVKKGDDAPDTATAIRDMLGYAVRNPTMIANFLAEQIPGAVVGGGAGAVLASPIRAAAVGTATRAGASAAVSGVVGTGVTGAGINTGAVALQSLGSNYVEGLRKYEGDTEAASEYAVTKTAAEVPANAIAGAFLGLNPFASKLANVATQATIQGAGGAAGAYQAATAVGEDASRGEMILEFFGEAVTAPIDLFQAKFAKDKTPEETKKIVEEKMQTEVGRKEILDILKENDLIPPTAEERAQITKERGADVEAAFGDTASTGTGVGTGATEPVIQRESVVPNTETKTLEPVGDEAQPVVLPEGKNTPSTVAMAPEDIVSRQSGFEVMPAFQIGSQPVANRFVSNAQAETFLFGPVDATTGKRSGGYAASVPDMDFQIRQGKRSKEQGGGTFYFVEGREKAPVTGQAQGAPSAGVATTPPTPAPTTPVAAPAPAPVASAPATEVADVQNQQAGTAGETKVAEAPQAEGAPAPAPAAPAPVPAAGAPAVQAAGVATETTKAPAKPTEAPAQTPKAQAKTPEAPAQTSEAPKQTVEQKLKEKQKAKKSKPEEKAGDAARAREMWEDSDGGDGNHVPFDQLPKEEQQMWVDAEGAGLLKDGEAAAKRHDMVMRTVGSRERANRASEKVKKSAPKEEDTSTYRVVSGGKGLTVEQVTKLYDRIVAAWANTPTAVIVQSESDLPAPIRAQIKRDGVSGKVPGLYNTGSGRVFLIADNLPNASEVAITIAHEITGHFGLRRLLGESYTKVMNDIYEGNASVRKLADKMIVDERLSKEIAVEEVLADMAERGVTAESRTALQQIFAAIRKFLRSIGVSYVSEGDVRQIVANARRYVIEGDIKAGEGRAPTGDVRKSGAATFYSSLERAFRSNKMEKMPADQWKSWLNSKKAELGVKKEEIEWVGISDWLDLKGKERVTKQEVLDFIAGNRVYLNEVELSTGKNAMSDDDLASLVEQITGEFPMAMPRDEMLDIVSEGMGWKRNRLGDAKHRQWTLEGGDDATYSELILTDPTIAPYKPTDKTHFGDVSAGKAIGWIRSIVRKDTDGRDVLFLEELQSQRGQDGRGKGFVKGDTLPDGWGVFKDERNGWYVIDNSKTQVGAYAQTKEEAVQNALSDSAVPDAPFVKNTQTWTSLLLKRAIAQAQKLGIDRIAWTTGEQQVARYKLSKRIDQIAYVKDKNTGEVMIAAMKDGKTLVEKVVPNDKVATVVGKDLAEQIEQNKGLEIDNDSETSGIISGLDLDVGGDGVAQYYNQTVPSVAKEILKNFGGKVDVMQIEGTGQQLGFVIPESLQQVVEQDGLPLFRRKDYESQYSDLPQAVREAALRKGHYSPPTIRQRLESLKPQMWLRVMQGMFDRFRAIRDVDDKAYKMARLSQSTDGAVEGLLHYGQVFDDDGALNVKKGTKGLLEILEPVGMEVDRFLLWVAANRADKLKREEREKFFTEDEIRQLTKINLGNMADGKARAPIYAEALRGMNELNKSVLEVAKSSGLIDEAAFRRFSSDVWYVPFYRIMEEDGSLAAAMNSTSSALVGQYMSKALKGSDRPLQDLMQNVLLNWSHILSASMRNKAANETMTAAVQMGGIVQRLDRAQKGSVKTMVNGKETHFAVEDDFLFDSLSALSMVPDYGMLTKVAREFKTTLTRFISLSPSFKINNLIRDSIQSIGLTELEKNPITNVISGYRAYKDKRAEALVGGGIFTLGNAFDGDQHAQVKRLLKQGVKSADVLTNAEKAKAWFGKAQDKYDEISDAMENANRLALYNQLREKGASHLEASYAARDLQDFSLQGSWAAIRYASQVLPYFNARLQGMYKLGRDGLYPSIATLIGKATDSERQKAAKFGVVLGAVTLAGLALYLGQMDDEDWQKREDWDRDMFFWFKVGDMAVRIPKPFEMGAIATVVERLVEQVVDENVEGKVFGKRLLAVLADNLAINPVPQIIRPLYDLERNKDGFTDRPIETMGMERVSKENRVTSGTSGAAVALSTVNSLFADFASAVTGGAVNAQNMQLSPVQYDYLIRGYLGWVGTVIQTASKEAAEVVKPGEATDRRIDDYFVVGNYVKSLPAAQSRFVTSFYENSKTMATAAADYRSYLEAGEVEKAEKLLDEKGDLIAMNKVYTRVQKQISSISKQIKQVNDDDSMSGEEKRLEIDRLNQLRVEWAKRAEELRVSRARGQ